MILQVIGVEHRKGNFTDKQGKNIDFDNIMIYALQPNTYDKNNGETFGSGKIPVEIKIKNDVDVVRSIFGSTITKDDLISMVGQEYNITFDNKKNVDSIMSVPAPAVPAKKGA